VNQATLQPLKVLTEAWLVRKHTVTKKVSWLLKVYHKCWVDTSFFTNITFL